MVAVFAGDKKSMGDVFYGSVGPRADDAIGRWLFGQRPADDKENKDNQQEEGEIDD